MLMVSVFHGLSVVLILLVGHLRSTQNECKMDAECSVNWPNAVCRKSRCACKPDSIRRPSESRGWVCLSLLDTVTGQLGPPITCPLPDGAGFRMILKDGEEKIVLCNFHLTSGSDRHTELEKPPPTGIGGCPPSHECIKAIGTFSDQWNGVCCPRREKTCDSMPDLDANGYLPRWYFNGVECEQFLWNPEATISANTFLTAQHCQSYCGGDKRR